MRLRPLALALVALATMGQAAPSPQPPPQVLFGPLFEAVQAARLYPDSKTFADATPREAPDAVMAAWRAEQPQGPAALRAFVNRHFVVPAEPGTRPSLREHIAALWPQLTRPALTPPPGSSALAMPQPYVVPGGRFREIYYWDSYFTMLGLKADGQDALIAGMLDDFDSLVARYGFVPNGTRTYYLGRSQPPFLALMADLDPRHDAATAARHLAALRAEHAFWMKGAAAARKSGASARVVRMPDGSLLNRYWDDAPGPRDESWREDVATARASGRPADQVYTDLRAGAESGWDYSSRWLGDPARLETIRTTQIVPVDLNSLLWAQEKAIARRCAEAGDRACAADFAAQADARARAIQRWLWLPAQGRFADWDRESRQASPRVSAATLYPLFVGLARPDQAQAVARLVRAQLLAPGGLRTTPLRTGQQWDDPNGWAPLQWIAHEGLLRYGEGDLAAQIARAWLGTVQAAYDSTGKMLEKYDVEAHAPGGGGEYPLQDGFGWTNGVTRVFLERYEPKG